MERSHSIFRAKSDREQFIQAYDETMKLWSVPWEDLMIPTRFGETHIVATGELNAPAVKR